MSSLPADDLQVLRHTMSVLAEHAFLMEKALLEVGFTGELGEKLLLEWWRVTLVSSNQPDIAGILKALGGGE